MADDLITIDVEKTMLTANGPVNLAIKTVVKLHFCVYWQDY